MAWESLPSDRTSMRPLDVSLGRLRRSLGLGRSDTVELVQSHWVQLVGSRLASHSEVLSVRRGVLVVGASDPAVVEQLRWSTADLVGAVNSVCGGEEISSVEVRLHRVNTPSDGD